MDYLVSGREMAELDRQTIHELGVPGRVLMETAGRAVAAACLERLSAKSRVAIVCGTGNNGGDGYVVATALAARGHRVDVYIVGERSTIRGDAAAALDTLEKVGGVEIIAGPAEALDRLNAGLDRADLVVDAMLGTGLHREVRGPLADAIDAVNRCSASVVSVDLPSGVDSDTGAVLGRAVHADVTVTFAFAKRGHYLAPGAARRGELRVIDIGIPRHLAGEAGIRGRVVHPSDGPALIPRRAADAHKGTFGHALVVAGSARTPGAGLLAVDGALRSGAGLVSWVLDDETLAAAHGLPPEVMLRRRGDDDDWAAAALEGITAAVIGPGLGTDEERAADLAAVFDALRVPACLDADALNLIAADPDLWSRVQAPAVVTPHPKEMARLTGTSVADVQRDRMAAAADLAAQRGCVVVLKGAGTVVAEPSGTTTVIDAGGPALAAGGTGDVLAGLIGGLLAQGLDPPAAAQAGALLHAVAGDLVAERFGLSGLRAGDVATAVGEVFARWDR